MSRSRLYFVTDAHLGAGDDSRQREISLCALLDEARHDAAKVFFLGDMFDFWFSYRHVVPRGYTRLLGKMAELADQGIELHFFIGNHDMWLFDYLSQEMGCIMHSDPEIIAYDDHRFLLGHGDGLGHLDHRYDLLRRIFRSRVNQRLFSLLPQWMTFGVAQGWSRSSRRSHLARDPHIFEYQGDDNEGIVLYVKQLMATEHFDYALFGHRHTPLVRTFTAPDGASVTYINVGDWLANRTYATYHDGQVVLRAYPSGTPFANT